MKKTLNNYNYNKTYYKYSQVQTKHSFPASLKSQLGAGLKSSE